MSAIETENLTKIFGNRLIAVNNLNLRVEEGSVYGLLGPNGAGKTTTVRLLLGLLRPSAGTAKVFGQHMTFNSANLRRRIGYLPTHPRFPPKMTPIKYLSFIGKLFDLDNEVITPRLSKLLRAVDLLPAASRKIKNFSTGMTTRLGIATALMNDPELLILDEPTAGLDPAGRKTMLDLIKELGREKTILVCSHILSDVDRICSHAGVIDEGKLVFSGTMKDLKKIVGTTSIHLELEGDIDAFCTKLGQIDGIVDFEKRGNYELKISFNPEAAIAATTAEIMVVISESNLEVIAFSKGATKVEDAFLKLLEEDESRGFLRAVEG